MQMRIVAGATVAVVILLVLGMFSDTFFACNSGEKINSFSSQFTVIVATVLFLRSKNQDELDKKTNNHLPLPLDYASNEGMLIIFVRLFYLLVNFILHFVNT